MPNQIKDLQKNQVNSELEIPANKKLDVLVIIVLSVYLTILSVFLLRYSAAPSVIRVYQPATGPIAIVLGLLIARLFISEPAATLTCTRLLFNKRYRLPPAIDWPSFDRVEIRRILFADYYLFFMKDATCKYSIVARLNTVFFGAPYLVAVSRLKISPEDFKEKVESFKAAAAGQSL